MKFAAEYIYSYGEELDTYKFNIPNPVPGPAARQSDGEKWEVLEGIGAGPILVKNSSIIPGNPENFNDYIMETRHPRSAICVDDRNRLYFVAIDGRYDQSAGMKIV